jgi:hypothetical protein
MDGGREGGREGCVCVCMCVCMCVCVHDRAHSLNLQLTFLRLLYVYTLEGTEVMGDKRARKVVEAIERGDLVTMLSSRGPGAGTHLGGRGGGGGVRREDLTLL